MVIALRGIGQRYEDWRVLWYEGGSSTKVLERAKSTKEEEPIETMWMRRVNPGVWVSIGCTDRVA